MCCQVRVKAYLLGDLIDYPFAFLFSMLLPLHARVRPIKRREREILHPFQLTIIEARDRHPIAAFFGSARLSKATELVQAVISGRRVLRKCCDPPLGGGWRSDLPVAPLHCSTIYLG